MSIDLYKDVYCLKIVNKNINMSVPWILMASYTYYHEDKHLISDELYDKLFNMIKSNDKITHFHRYIIEDYHMIIGSLFDIKKEDYPTRIIGAALALYNTKV